MRRRYARGHLPKLSVFLIISLEYVFFGYYSEQPTAVSKLSQPLWNYVQSLWRQEMEALSGFIILCEKYTAHRWIPITKNQLYVAFVIFFIFSFNSRGIDDLRRHGAHDDGSHWHVMDV